LAQASSAYSLCLLKSTFVVVRLAMPFLQHLVLCTALLCTNLQASRIKASRKARVINSVDELDGEQAARSGDAAQEHYLCAEWFPNGCVKTSSRTNTFRRQKCPETCAGMQPEASELVDPMQTMVEATTGKGGEEYCKTLGLTKCTAQQATACPEWCEGKPRVEAVAPKVAVSTVNRVNKEVPDWRSGLTKTVISEAQKKTPVEVETVPAWRSHLTEVDKEHKGATAAKVNVDLPPICAELKAKKDAGKEATCNGVARMLCEKAQPGFCHSLA